MNTSPIFLASDHAGFLLKAALITHLDQRNLSHFNLGTDSSDSVDYPPFAHMLATLVHDTPGSTGVLICGTGLGMSMAANRHPGVRCAVALTPEMAVLARLHNDANVLALGARLIDTGTATAILDSFISTEFEGGRHVARVAQIELPDAEKLMVPENCVYRY